MQRQAWSVHKDQKYEYRIITVLQQCYRRRHHGQYIVRVEFSALFPTTFKEPGNKATLLMGHDVFSKQGFKQCFLKFQKDADEKYNLCEAVKLRDMSFSYKITPPCNNTHKSTNVYTILML